MKVYIKTLGCDKNTWDSEHAAGLLQAAGCSFTDDPSQADVMMVNTCGFIRDAKTQSIDTIFDLINIKTDKQKLIVSGCLSQRYSKELAKEMPEVDLFLGVNDYARLPQIIREESSGVFCSPYSRSFEELGERKIGEGCYTAPIKIAEGCNNICSYCAIPFIRGRYRSRKEEDIIAEAEALAKAGCKELVVIAQDVTAYGCDLDGGKTLAGLLRKLCRVEGLAWIRLMYCYEDEITQELIDVIKEEPKICRYLDIPVQHCSDRILASMNRKSTSDSIRLTINNLRKQIPDIAIRTTLITGYPGETAEDFKELLDFVKELKFERLGAFAYSKEEGTAAAKLPKQVRSDVKERRRDRIMEAQRSVSLEHNLALVGRELEVMVDEADAEGSYIGRTRFDAPDIDNSVIFTTGKKHVPGDIVTVRITDAFDYDLTGEEI